MRVSFDGTTYDMDKDDAALRNACAAKARRVVAAMKPDDLREALEDMVGATSMIAVKLGGMAALHHAYKAPVPYDIIDVFAHTLNRLVGLQYLPPDFKQENESEQQAEENAQVEGADNAGDRGVH